ncbi:MAG TPA: DUF4270 domain-containing protein [Mucilaginibacter sp.]
MKFFKLDLLTLLISLFILTGCKNQDSIGLGVNTATQLNGSLIDTATIIVNTIPEDSVQTNALPKTPLSYFKDPIFGTTEANLAVDLNLPGQASSYTLPTGTVSVDSAVLVLRYTDGFYGDSLASRYKVNVYQLGERIFTNSVYYNTKQWKYNNTLLGTRSFLARPNDSIRVNAIVPGAPDSLQKSPPQLRIPIDKSFINSILFNASSTQLSSNLVFKNTVNGLYITMDKAGTTGAGGTLMFNLDTTNINIYYKAVSGSTIDTAMISLPTTLHAAQIKHTYPAAIQTELNNTKTTRNTFYLQGLAGLRAKISFPYLKNIIKSVGSDIVINRAELVITPMTGSTIPFAPLPKISMYRYDLAHQRSELQDATATDPRSGGVLTFGGFYNSTLQNYHFVITAYIQDLMRGASVDYGTFLGPVDINSTTSSTAVDIDATPQAAARTFAIGTDKTSPYRIKLNIIYTKITK